MTERWTDETEDIVAGIVGDETYPHGDPDGPSRPVAVQILAALADAGLLAVPGTTGDAEAWRHNAKLHNDMRRRIQQVATHAAAEQRTLSWVADELADILDDPQAWAGETVDTEEAKP